MRITKKCGYSTFYTITIMNPNGKTSLDSPKDNQAKTKSNANEIPQISLPKGGGAIKGIGEKFAANTVTGTGSITIPIATSPGRLGFGPQLPRNSN